METIHYDEHFHAYAVKHLVANRLGCVDVETLKDHVPYQVHMIMYEQSQHMLVALRYSLLKYTNLLCTVIDSHFVNTVFSA